MALWQRLAEEFRILRTQVKRALHDEAHKTLLVTSSVAQEGKTTVAANLSRALAMAGWRVLLADADLRRPDLQDLFRVESAEGLTDVVQGRATLERAALPTDVENLDLLAAGGRAAQPAELIDSPAFRELLKEAAKRYDCVVLDSAPLISITDSQLLARYADGILLVVGGRSTPRQVVQTAFEQLLDRPVLGVVLNGISTPSLP